MGKDHCWNYDCKKGENINFSCKYKRLKEGKVKFPIEDDKKEFKSCIITLCIEEIPDVNISDTSNELKQVLVHNCVYTGCSKKIC